MLAAHHDQENVLSHHAGTSKQLQAKTPGGRFLKTPLKVPLNDENANHAFGGKSVLRTKGNDENIATVSKGGNGLGKSGKLNAKTPAEPRTGRAPLGNKTTNAKAKATQQTGGVKEIVREFEKTTIKPTTTVRPKQAAPQTESSKLEVHTDKDPLDSEEEIEYAPPRLEDPPYESDVFPAGALTYEGMKPENLFNGYYDYYFNRIDENGMTAQERLTEERRRQDLERGEGQILRDMEEFDWSVGDVPATKTAFKVKRDANAPVGPKQTKVATRLAPKAPNTITSRRAAAALAVPAKPAKTTAELKAMKPPLTSSAKPQSFLLSRKKSSQTTVQPTLASQERASAAIASRSTIGYSKGRSALSANRQPELPLMRGPRALTRTASTASSGSDSTITPARFAQTQATNDWKRPDFMSIFDVDEAPGDDIAIPPPPPSVDSDDFQFSTDF
ncbi:hypothetical protein QBC47DRAFT_456206 [Echria macrotheca]|uniref:Uncharacterized protein n=1 Tax=Echria macrotheca TaxID=438768 RepID=A0AAJ0BP69_9PEZI|nr:hypothetical protein QBC47DRAFT_456206 [Echria macrotheca]